MIAALRPFHRALATCCPPTRARPPGRVYRVWRSVEAELLPGYLARGFLSSPDANNRRTPAFGRITLNSVSGRPNSPLGTRIVDDARLRSRPGVVSKVSMSTLSRPCWNGTGTRLRGLVKDRRSSGSTRALDRPRLGTSAPAVCRAGRDRRRHCDARPRAARHLPRLAGAVRVGRRRRFAPRRRRHRRRLARPTARPRASGRPRSDRLAGDPAAAPAWRRRPARSSTTAWTSSTRSGHRWPGIPTTSGSGCSPASGNGSARKRRSSDGPPRSEMTSGSRLVAARLARDLIRLCFLLERRYAPYSKWLGSAFAQLEASTIVGPILERALDARNRTLASGRSRKPTRRSQRATTASASPIRSTRPCAPSTAARSW